MNAQHLSIDELADAAEGLPGPDRAAFVESHLADCAECSANWEALREVTATFGPTSLPRVNSLYLGAEASALERTSGGLSPHRFSQAWGCARQVTDECITGLASSTVDGMPALLVYTESGDSMHVTVVTGCGGGTPAAGPSAVVPR